MKLSRRAQRLGESATMRVTRRAAELEAGGIPVIDLGTGEPDFPSARAALHAGEQALREGLTRYTAAAGSADLRCALARRYAERHGAPWQGDGDVVITVGAKGALFQLALALLEEGDQVLVPAPGWVSFAAQVNLAGAQALSVPMPEEQGFALRSKPLLDAFTERTRVILLNSPCNPTGAVMARGELARLVEECARRGVLVISDETYDRYVYDGLEAPSAAELAGDFPDSVVVVGSFSKTYAMTGWRVGYALGPRVLIEAVVRLQGHAVTHPASFAMAGALAALEGAEDEVRERIAEYQRRRDLLVAGLAALPGFECSPPAGTFYCFPRVDALFGRDLPGSVELAELLLEQAAVAVVPGAAFGGDRHLRVSFACATAKLEEGLERMARVLAARAGAGG